MTVTEAVIDLAAFDANVRHLAATVAPAELMVVVKADAYGHGALETALRAARSGATRLGTLDIPTALAIRAAGVGPDVTIFAWQYPPNQDFRAAVAARIDLGVSRVDELRAMAAVADGVPARLHLKIDTGLQRNGATTAEWPVLVAEARRLQAEGSVRAHGIWTHIAEASDDEDSLSIMRFRDAIAVADQLGVHFAVRHLAASSAGFRREDARFDMVRMGGHCWGIPSFDGVTPLQMGLRPVMTLVTEVDAVRHTADGAVEVELPLGYADGIPPAAAGLVHVAVGGRQYPVVSVAVDSMVLRADAPVRVGDRATLFGTGDDGEQTVRQWGDLIGTLGDEIVTRIAPSVPRRYVG
ncbi:alanine racemase [Marisediminicola senii]|uniref:alanine racemase n=1 Tax=Marisediminicola senii TaxID=2711233 RepID=UPI0013EE0DF5|nr:alanine racemase [Marisediminicola senii]